MRGNSKNMPQMPSWQYDHAQTIDSILKHHEPEDFSQKRKHARLNSIEKQFIAQKALTDFIPSEEVTSVQPSTISNSAFYSAKNRKMMDIHSTNNM